MKNRNSRVILSAIAVLALGSNAYAGKIISNADGDNYQNPTVTPNTQYGFGGWNFNNVDVHMINLDGSPTTATFNTADGSYTPMSEGMSFDSDLKNVTGYTNGEPVIGTTVMGQLHGKDWPVGEPAGIKIINDDEKCKGGKPTNCIMTSSYLEFQDMTDPNSGSAYLDSGDPKPVVCSSPFQTHKRYKINLLPTVVDGVADGEWAKPVDVVFNLDVSDTNTSIRRYQVLQKANNYTGKRLDGLKIEVLDENGTKNDFLTLSLGEGEGENDLGVVDGTVDIWEENQMANMSHGLWGPYELHDGELRFDNGFFDYQRVYFNVELNATDNNRSLSYVGPMLGGNYQDVFGNWLPSIWEPKGIFFDEDQNPATDNILQAFYGVAPGKTERTWWKRSVDYNPDTPNVAPVYNWEPATDADFATWTGEWYNEGPIEDVLNLGLNYIINVGENAKIGKTFTLRITPHVDTNQTPPSSYDKNHMDPKYDFEAAADFNDDGIDDILWKDPSTGDIVIWYMNSDGTHEDKDIGVSNLNYNIEAAANLNDGNIADILWKDPVTGILNIWYMDSSGTYVEKELLQSHISYSIEGVTDFNNDGIADILARNRSTGSMGIEYLYSDGSHSWKFLLASDPTYTVEGVADFNNDGIADILARKRSTGRTGIEYIDINGNVSWKFLLNTNVNYDINDVADFNDDGIADILARNPSTGRTGIEYVDINGNVSWKFIDSSLGVDYNIESAAILNNDTINDIFWRNPSTGDNIIWYMNSDGSHD